MDRLRVFKVLGDNTRYAIYLELARSSVPLTTTEISDILELHPNTVRPHLERMREVGLIEVEVISRGTVGRPLHRFFLAADAPSLGLEPSSLPLLTKLLAGVASSKLPRPDEVAEVARPAGEAAAISRTPAAACVSGLMDELTNLGFDPVCADEGKTASIAFTHCPYLELAQVFPDLVCNLHRGIVEGYVSGSGGAEVVRFATLADRDPCRVELTVK